MDSNFCEYLRSGKSLTGSEGGVLVPYTIRAKTKGFKGWWFRLIKDKRGYYDYSFMDYLIERAKNG